MSTLVMHREHSMSTDKLKDGLQQIADHLSDNFGMEYEWKGDDIHFNKSGAKGGKGVLKVSETALDLNLKLGLLARPFKSKIESELNRFLDEHLT